MCSQLIMYILWSSDTNSRRLAQDCVKLVLPVDKKMSYVEKQVSALTNANCMRQLICPGPRLYD